MVRPLQMRQMQPRRAELVQNCMQAPAHTEQPPHDRNRNNTGGSHGRVQNVRQRRKDHGHAIRGQYTSTLEGRIGHMVATTARHTGKTCQLRMAFTKMQTLRTPRSKPVREATDRARGRAHSTTVSSSPRWDCFCTIRSFFRWGRLHTRRHLSCRCRCTTYCGTSTASAHPRALQGLSWLSQGTAQHHWPRHTYVALRCIS